MLATDRAQAQKSAAPNPAAKIDLNSATLEELNTLPGVGPSTARKIIAGRPYKFVDDLKRAGISEAEIAKLKLHVEVKATSGAKPSKPDTGASKEKINLNAATADDLAQLPGVGAA